MIFVRQHPSMVPTTCEDGTSLILAHPSAAVSPVLYLYTTPSSRNRGLEIQLSSLYSMIARYRSVASPPRQVTEIWSEIVP